MNDTAGNETTNSTTTPNSGSSDNDMQWFEYPGWRWAFNNIIIWLMPALLVFGIVFNILCFITILLSNKTFPKISRRNMLIITACDTVVLSIGGFSCYQIYLIKTVSYTVLKPFMSLMHMNAASCHIVNYLYKFMLNCTPYFQVGLTVERVLAVVLPLKVKRIMTNRNHAIMLLVLFLLGSLDPALWSAEQQFIDNRCDSRVDKNVLLILDRMQYNIEFYVSKTTLFIILLTGCIIVAVALRIQASKVTRLTTSSACLKRNKMVGACAAMIAMNVLFFLTHAPRAAFSVYQGYSGVVWPKYLTESQLDLGYQILEGFMFLHSIIDPISYFIGRSFRSAFRKIIGGAFCFLTAGLCGRRRLPERKETAINMTTSVTATYNAGASNVGQIQL